MSNWYKLDLLRTRLKREMRDLGFSEEFIAAELADCRTEQEVMRVLRVAQAIREERAVPAC